VTDDLARVLDLKLRTQSLGFELSYRANVCLDRLAGQEGPYTLIERKTRKTRKIKWDGKKRQAYFL
jgi:hypothetical protein